MKTYHRVGETKSRHHPNNPWEVSSPGMVHLFNHMPICFLPIHFLLVPGVNYIADRRGCIPTEI